MVGIDAPRHALDADHGLLQQDQFRAQVHVELGGDLEQLGQQAAHRHFGRRAAQHGLADGAQGLGEAVDVLVRRHVAGLEMDLGDALVVAAQEAPQHFGQIAPLFRLQPADNAEIDGNQLVRRLDEQVTFVQVGVEDAVVERLGQEGANEIVGQGQLVDAGQVQRLGARQRHGVDPARHQDAPRHIVPMHLGRAHPRFGIDDLADLVGRRSLKTQVEFQQQRPRHGLDESFGLQALGDRRQRGDDLRRQAQHGDVGGDHFLDMRAQDLDGDLVAVLQRGAMGLGDRGGPQHLAEVQEQLGHRLAQRLGDLGFRHGLRKRCQLVLEMAQVLGELRAEDIAARRQDLAQLDEGWPHGLKRLGVALAGTQTGLLGDQATRDIGKEARHRRQKAGNLFRDKGVVAHQDPTGPHHAYP